MQVNNGDDDSSIKKVLSPLLRDPAVEMKETEARDDNVTFVKLLNNPSFCRIQNRKLSI